MVFSTQITSCSHKIVRTIVGIKKKFSGMKDSFKPKTSYLCANVCTNRFSCYHLLFPPKLSREFIGSFTSSFYYIQIKSFINVE